MPSFAKSNPSKELGMHVAMGVEGPVPKTVVGSLVC
jgi:hypothetical protein